MCSTRANPQSLLAVGWHGGEKNFLKINVNVGAIVEFMVVGFALNVIGAAYFLLSKLTAMRRVTTGRRCRLLRVGLGKHLWQSDQRRLAAFDAYMPVCWPSHGIPGCLVALYLVARLRHRG